MLLRERKDWEFPGFKNEKARKALGSVSIDVTTSGEDYELIVGEGYCSVIPTIVIAGVYNGIHRKRGRPEAPMRFVDNDYKLPIRGGFLPNRSQGGRVLLVAEYANTGNTLWSLSEKLTNEGISSDMIDYAFVDGTTVAVESLRYLSNKRQRFYPNEKYSNKGIYRAFYNETARAFAKSLATNETMLTHRDTRYGHDPIRASQVSGEIQRVISHTVRSAFAVDSI